MYERKLQLRGPVAHTGCRQFARYWSIRQNSTPKAISRYLIRHFANCDGYEISFAICCKDYMPIPIVGKMPVIRKSVSDTVDGGR